MTTNELKEIEEEDGLTDVDPITQSIKSRHLELFIRVFFGAGAAIYCWKEYSDFSAVIAFVFVYYFLPRIMPRTVHLKNGRTVLCMNSSVNKLIEGRNYGKDALYVKYIAGPKSRKEKDREFLEVCCAVLKACDQRKLLNAEVTVEFPKDGFLAWGLGLIAESHSAVFEKREGQWIQLSGYEELLEEQANS
jgi:hypothetical protein